jgi:Flp pilus assembly pilin Flp
VRHTQTDLIRGSLDRRAVTALEYALIAGLIVAIIAIGFGRLGTNLSNKFSGIGGSL